MWLGGMICSWLCHKGQTLVQLYLEWEYIVISPAQCAYTPYEGLNLANHINRKLEVFGRKFEETSPNCIDILIKFNISKNETILFN